MSNNKRVRNRGTQINKKKSLVIFAIVLLAAIIGIAMASSSSFLKSTSSTNFPHNQQEQQPASYPITQKLSDPSIYTAPPLGSSAAKVTLIEFGDYQCTYCHRFHIDTKGSLLANFVNTGKVKFLFKDFPINDLPDDRASTLAAEASYCAADQGKYWQYHDELYNNWKGENTGWVTKNSLEQFANNTGVKKIHQFSLCIESGKYAGVVADNFKLAESIGLNATPSFVLLRNGKQPLEIVGAQPYSVFENAINQLTM
jgi:protein-disulfide isomerase